VSSDANVLRASAKVIESAPPPASPPAEPADGVEPSGPPTTTGKYLRGSSLLLAGRGVSLLLNLAVQVLSVRVLSKSDYGAFAYALGVASIGSSAVLLGLDKAVSRFVPLYQERGEERKAFGTLALAVALVVGLGISAVLIIYGLRGVLLGSVVSDPLSLALLLILIALAPIQALDSLLQHVIAIFVGARAIFFRRHVVGPGLKLAAVLLVMAASGDAYLLAYGYLAAGLLGVALYVWILVRVWHRSGVLARLRLRTLELPVRELLGYSLPLLSSVLVTLIAGSFAVVLLEYFHGTREVAAFRAVLPVARLNLVVLESFSLLFIPLASRMFARGDRDGLNDLYWQTATWISVLTFPVFAITVCLARPVTLLLFGSAYASSASLLGILSVGFYFYAALGFNAFTLRVHGRVGPVFVINTVAAVLGVGITALLAARFGAVGAALGVTCTLVLHSLLNHVGLLVLNTGVRLLNGRFLRIYVVIEAMAGGLLAVQEWFSPPVYASLALTGLAWLGVIRLTRRELDPATTFPELMRIPLARRLLR
jgi:O-antigen/teichoic acid export membrane protein